MLPILSAKQESKDLLQFSVISTSLIFFSYFSNSNLALALVFLAVSQCVMIAALLPYSWREIIRFFGINLNRKAIFWTLLCILAAFAAAIAYRISLREDPLPAGPGMFALASLLIGAAEEFVFRGFLFAKLIRLHPFLQTLFSSLAHTLYKVALFAPFNDLPIGRLFVYTFIFGLLLGYTRTASKSLLPCLAFHCFFDVLVYGERTGSPWWVW